MAVEWKAGKVESILGFLDQYDWEGLFDTKGVPVSHRNAYKVRAEAMHAFRRKILEAVVDPSKASRIADWKRELQALAITDPMEYESFDKWRRALQAGEHAHHGRGGLNVLQNVGKLPNAAQYDLHQALKEGYDTVIGQPKSKGPIILSNWMHKGSKSVPPWEVGSVLRSAHREGTSGLGRFSLMMNPQSTGSSLAQQLIRNTGHYADWDNEAWEAYRASYDYIRQSGLEGNPLSRLSTAVTDSQSTQRLFASERGVGDLPFSTDAATGTEKLVDGTKVPKGADMITTGGKRFVQKAGKWLQVLGDIPAPLRIGSLLTIAGLTGDALQAAETTGEVQEKGFGAKQFMDAASVATGLASAIPGGQLAAIPATVFGLTGAAMGRREDQQALRKDQFKNPQDYRWNKDNTKFERKIFSYLD